jgi:hypothetical protein
MKTLLIMKNKFNITIPKPCHEDWNSMTPEETGRFCSVCTKGVVDFTNKNPEEIQNYFNQNKGQKICGRFKIEQVGRFDISIPQSILQQKMSFHKAFLLTLFIVMGSTLFSCKNHNDATLGEVSVVEDTTATKENKLIGDTVYIPKDTIKENHVLGISLPPKKDSITKKE